MLSKAQIKYIRSLTQQKYRKEHQVFLAEGDKIAKEWLTSDTPIELVAGLAVWIENNKALLEKHPEAEIVAVDEGQLSTISALKTPNQVLLVAAIPARPETPPLNGWTLALESIQDPGNMGTLIRIADWFGIPNIVCSPDCVDVYNPKVVQAAMGGHLRVKLYEANLGAYIDALHIPVVAATLDGESIYKISPQDEAVLLIGNESKGLSSALVAKTTQQVTIPQKGGAESLNAAVAAGILCSHLVPH